MRSIVGVLKKIYLSRHARDVEVWRPHTQHASLFEKLMPVACSHRLRSAGRAEDAESDGALSRLSLHASASPWASPRGECLCDKRRQLLVQKELLRSLVYVRIRLVRRAGLTASKIHKRVGHCEILFWGIPSDSHCTLIASRSVGAEYDCFIIRSSSRTWKSSAFFFLSGAPSSSLRLSTFSRVLRLRFHFVYHHPIVQKFDNFVVTTFIR